MIRRDPTDLFAADAFCMDAGSLFIQAVTAGERGDYARQRALVEQATSQIGKALSLMNPATRSGSAQPLLEAA